MPLHPFRRRLLAEHLVRTRRADDRERYAASQRHARVDANPHQIDAVLFALRRLRAGGCILADEVGLGKTIEAGLVIAQLRAERAERILLIVPKALLGQWQTELAALFGIQVREEHHQFGPPGVYVIGRERAGSDAGARAIAESPPFDLVVIDEAHEVFSGLHRRFDADGAIDDTSPHATIAYRVKEAIGPAPVLLLTATPLQNSLAELWSLVHFVEPTGTLLGDLPTFRAVFCKDDDRSLVHGQENELQRRLSVVVQRTLRRQAQEFLERPFTERRCRLYEYTMSSDERALYDDVTAYLLEPTLYAFRGKGRRLLLLGFHRRMASSIAALAASLDNVADRLAAIVGGQNPMDDRLVDDLEDEDDPDPSDAAGEPPPPPPDPEAVAAELNRVRDLARRARALPSDAKARAFLDAVRVVCTRADGSGKVVVFTESITTQEYLRDLLVQGGFSEEEITLFRGTNDSPRARAAHDRWATEVGAQLAPAARPTKDIAVRMALVHEFRTRSRIFISTEAGAKGLNLQFCDTVVNFDLPWNPQRIEQRIGRCHRYRQERDVTVVNFVGRDNDAARLTFEILSEKLELFGTVLDATDQVLHEARPTQTELVAGALAQEIERDLQDIYTRARTLDERTREMEALRERVAERREAYEREYRRTSQIIEARFDEQIRSVFRKFREEIPTALAQFDRDLADLLEGHLVDRGVPFTRSDEGGRARFEVQTDLPELGGARVVATGDARGLSDGQPLNLTHPLVVAALAATRAIERMEIEVAVEPAGLAGELVVIRVDYRGFEPVQRLVAAAALENGTILSPDVVAHLLVAEARDAAVEVSVDPAVLRDAIEEAAFDDQHEVEVDEQRHFERAVGQLERYVEDKIFVLRRQRRALGRQLREARERREAIVGADARRKLDVRIETLEERDQRLAARIDALHSREDEAYRRWREHHQAQRYQPPTRTEILRLRFRTVTPW